MNTVGQHLTTYKFFSRLLADFPHSEPRVDVLPNGMTRVLEKSSSGDIFLGDFQQPL
jgi:hypothetical protein